VVFKRSRVKRGFAVVVARVQLGTGRDQKQHGFAVPARRRGLQRRPAEFVVGVDIRARGY
jgi:hypothetical protein|tara:strand:- start:1546 stop:1725 length:180 start_codon:yes stop_codon:yes gene_type:complete